MREKKITIDEAYEIIKHIVRTPVLSLLDTPERFWGSAYGELIAVDKMTGKSEAVGTLDWILNLSGEDKYVYYPKMFDDFYEYCDEHTTEKDIADLYASAWNALCDEKETDIGYNNDADKENVLLRWSEIEGTLYSKIQIIMENDDSIVYPPCVLDKNDDPFYRIKPFMVINGWTDHTNARRWVVA